MNYYPFHIGDYASATRHLSWDEDAAYRRLLDTYYSSEKALPADLRAVCRLVLATTEAQREAVRVVLEEFFTMTADGWVNGRADAEIDLLLTNVIPANVPAENLGKRRFNIEARHRVKVIQTAVELPHTYVAVPPTGDEHAQIRHQSQGQDTFIMHRLPDVQQLAQPVPYIHTPLLRARENNTFPVRPSW